MRRETFIATLLLCVPAGLRAQQQTPPLLGEEIITALSAGISGERAFRTVEAISLHHRTRGSRPLRSALDFIIARAREGGLEQARIEEFRADGKVFYGTQRSRPPWNAEFAELWEVRREGGAWKRSSLLASWDTQPMTLAQDSESGEAIAELIDIGTGRTESDYAGKNVRGSLVLTSSQPGQITALAIARHGAAGIVSYAQNQRSAWWGEDESLIRWGHLETFDPVKTFAFMVSPATARGLQARLARGERITLHAKVVAGAKPGTYDIGSALITGRDARLRGEEIVFSCHIDHPRPGANDNASGCATILEAGVALAKLVNEKRIPRPLRSIRFIWPPEIEGTLTILNARPEWAKRVKAVVHMDMVGGGPKTKARFHLTRGPASLPSFVYDVGEAFGQFVNAQSYQYAATGSARFPLVSLEGGKEPLNAELEEFSMGSDHQVYSDGSWRIPAIYMNDWPDIYIHTTGDTPANIDPTKLRRAAFIGAASAYFLASMSAADLPAVNHVVRAGALRRELRLHHRMAGAATEERANMERFSREYEAAVLASIANFLDAEASGRPQPSRMPASDTSLPVYRRNPAVKGTMGGFGYDYFADRFLSRGRTVRLLAVSSERASGGEYAYEVLNLVDGRRTVRDIRDDVSAIYGPVSLEVVAEYLAALAEIGVVSRVR